MTRVRPARAAYLARHPHLWRICMRATMSPIWTNAGRIRLLRLIGVQVPYSATIPDAVFIGSTLVSFGENSGCSWGCFFDGSAPLHIGEGARLGAEVKICTVGHPIEDTLPRRDCSKPPIPRPVTIGRGAWLGSCVRINGVSVGEGCVIGMGALLTREAHPNGLYLSPPAQRARDLPVASVLLAMEVA